ncbi:conserved hypothetical protein [Leishmania infantum JPCM5]|uniref:Flagellar-associated_PapD-like_-_putative n=2 Tax=Leishmania infantum TaxID=5671 RepID=A0A6L0WMF8_LEIIN|nr:conserved hypothetical protein [Leishmania infantum JPCM5]CAC9461823.1 Flagellar-associated_PapD-like_-_putative [Leishmania infantum]CAM66304.1 conserved hypothetical protein [Leishmania infantum JPCM5]SUZ39915.1 Flagellar-associated_PapD-like_-_putative [Leishmania infantum]|eukprot:XP_001463930.1 conserved hypothetical protein [Leishmania infantum JPCM5]
MAADTAVPSNCDGALEKHFRPIVFLLNSHTPDNVDAATVADLLHPFFRKDDYYVVNASTVANPIGILREAKKSLSSEASLQAAAASVQDRLSAAVQSALTNIAATRREAQQAALQAKEAQLSALQADYVEDGLSAEEARAAAHAELQERSESEGEESYSSAGERLPPAVCVVNAPLLPAAVARLACDVGGLAAVVLLESPCSVRELVSVAGAGGRKSSTSVAASNAPNDRAKGRGPGAGAAAASSSSTSKQHHFSAAAGGSAEDLLAALGRAALAQPDDNAFQDVLLQHVPYPTERANSTDASPESPALLRPSIPAAQFLPTLHALLLRIFSCWVRYNAWRARRFLVQVPAYTPLIDSEAALSAVAGEDALAAAAAAEQRPNKRKSGGPGGHEDNVPLPISTKLPTTTPRPCTMAQVAAEQFEYTAYMQRWMRSASHGSTDNVLAAGEAVQACLKGCLCQVASLKGSSTLRTSADTSAAQLGEDIADACARCRIAVAVSSGASLRPPKDGVEAACQDKGAATCGATPISAPASAGLTADSVEEALAHIVTEEVGSAALPSVTTALITTAGDGDALHWMRDALLARDHHGWHTAVQRWGRTAVYCLHQQTHAIGAPRTQHTAHLLDSPTTFPRFFREEEFLEAEGRHYAPSSLSDDTEKDEEESESDSSSEETTSDSCGDDTASAAEDAATKMVPTAVREMPPACPTVDHVDIVSQHLRRRRVLEQVRLSHARPPVQELMGCATPCRTVVTETQWMRAADGTLVEVARTAANSAQVRCTIVDAGIDLEAGFMLDCPPPTVDDFAKATAVDARASGSLPEPLLSSAVRGFLSLGRELRVITEVVADNAQAVAQAAYAAAVAAAKEAAVTQYEAQFRRVGKASKSREEAKAANQLTLEQITKTLLDALPSPPPSPPPEGGDGKTAAARIVMRVHACFLLHDCVMTAAAPKAGAPGVQLRCLKPSQHTTHLPRRRLLSVQLWNEGVVSTVALTHLQAIDVYLDGVVEVHSPDLAAGVRLLLYKNGSYVTVSGRCQLLVSPDGRVTRYENGEGGRLVHKLQRGRATAVSAPAVHRVEREDGLHLEGIESSGADDDGQASLIPCSLGHVRCIRFGTGVVVEQGDKDGMWSWRFVGLPTVYCDVAAYQIAAAIGKGECDRLAYQPRTDSFSLFLNDSEAEGARVAADVAMSSCRISVFTQGCDLSTARTDQGDRTGVFAVDCAYGGVYGRVGADRVYRVSPFGRCSEEVEHGGDLRYRQLVLPEHYKRPKKTAEALLLPEYASPSFRRAVAGEGGDLTTVPSADHTDALHLQAVPLLLPKEPARISASTAASPYSTLAVQHPAACVPLQLRCIALQEDGSQVTVLDAASWLEWVMWWQRHSSWAPQYSSPTPKEALREGAPEERPFRLIRALRARQAFVPFTEPGAENVPAEASVVQECVLRLPSREAASAPSWCAAGSLARTSAVSGVTGAADEEDTAPAAAVAEAAVPLDAAPVSPIVAREEEQVPMAALTDAHCVTELPAAVGRRGGSLNYWTSALCPQALQPSRDSSRTENGVAMPMARTHTANLSADAATSEAPAPPSPAVPAAMPKKTLSWQSSKVPLMHSYHPAADELTGTNASSRFHTPRLEVHPRKVEFGNVLPLRRYVTTVRLTNASTVPCRYRVRVGAVVRPFLSVSYSRQFVAPGITTEMHVELSGSQPYGVMDSHISIVHEGGTVEVNVWWCTTDEADTARLGDGVTCAGWTVHKPAIQHPRMPEQETEQTDDRSTLSDTDVALDVRTA